MDFDVQQAPQLRQGGAAIICMRGSLIERGDDASAIRTRLLQRKHRHRAHVPIAPICIRPNGNRPSVVRH